MTNQVDPIPAGTSHECPYEARLETTLLHNRVPARQAELAVAHALAEIHTDGTCPPTHIDGSPTKPWSDLVRDTKR